MRRVSLHKYSFPDPPYNLLEGSVPLGINSLVSTENKVNDVLESLDDSEYLSKVNVTNNPSGDLGK